MEVPQSPLCAVDQPQNSGDKKSIRLVNDNLYPRCSSFRPLQTSTLICHPSVAHHGLASPFKQNYEYPPYHEIRGYIHFLPSYKVSVRESLKSAKSFIRSGSSALKAGKSRTCIFSTN